MIAQGFQSEARRFPAPDQAGVIRFDLGSAAIEPQESAANSSQAPDRGTAHDQARGVIVRLQDVAELVGGAEQSDAAVGENGTERRRRERIGVDVSRPVGQQDLLLLAVGLNRADVVAISITSEAEAAIRIKSLKVMSSLTRPPFGRLNVKQTPQSDQAAGWTSIRRSGVEVPEGGV